MTFRVEFTKSAAKALKAIPKSDQKRIAQKIESLAPGPSHVKLFWNQRPPHIASRAQFSNFVGLAPAPFLVMS